MNDFHGLDCRCGGPLCPSRRARRLVVAAILFAAMVLTILILNATEVP